ncbi:hypothetical protein ES319_D07G225000v1 [Gossypium barbadense]|uniref:TNase-like domain-containing protein n=1 Tax=Gossypium barbadense TaxID=3634 RepID=A0A5J5QX41_GOSBA|nr:hypothetical protein ES319_D07G225000v1 [Gossypium barbadense]
MGRRAVAETVVETDLTSDVQNGDASTKPWAALTSVQKLFASAPAAAEVSYDPFRIEAKHFTEVRYLNRDVRIVLEGVDKFSNLIGSVYYHKCETGKDLVLELVENRLLAGTALLWLMTSLYGSSLAECRVNLSSIRCPKIRNPRRDEKPTAYAREAREFLKTHLIGKQIVNTPRGGVQSSNDRFEVFYLNYGN